MDEAELVDPFQCEHALGNVEPRHVLGEGVVFDEHRHQVAAGQKLHQEVQVRRVLEGVVQLHHPRRVRLGEHITLRTHMRELVLFKHLALAQRLHRIDFSGIVLLHDTHLAKGAFANHLDRAEVG